MRACSERASTSRRRPEARHKQGSAYLMLPQFAPLDQIVHGVGGDM